VEAASPHQRQVTREVDDDTRAQASELVGEAREMAQAGDEEGCMAKVTETKELLGTN
jgi:transaldolase